MSIVRMKKLQVVAAREQRDDLLKELMLLGCVELSSQDIVLDSPETAFIVRKETVDIPALRVQRQLYSSALKVLDKFAPQKSPLFSTREEIRESEFTDESGEATLKTVAKEVSFMEDKLKNLASDETREKLRIESLLPWKDCSIPLDTTGTKNVGILFGTLPAYTVMDRFYYDVDAALPESQIWEISADENLRYIIVFFYRGGQEELMRVLREYSFAVPAYGYIKGLASENIALSRQHLDEISQERSRAEERIRACADFIPGLKICYDRAVSRIERAEAAEKLLGTDSIIMLQGWAVESEEEKLTALLEDFGCAYELSEPSKEEYPEVPVKLKNNALTNGLNMVTNMYSLPQYGTVDPNPLMAPFFILFYGIMMADMGYGLLMIAIGAFVLCKLKPDEGFMKHFGQLMIEGGIATFIVGAITGGFFGDALYHLVRLADPSSSWEGLPALFNPLEDTIMVLAGAMVLGFIHLNAGMVISFVMKKRAGRLMDALWYEGAFWLIFICAGLAFLKIGTVSGIPLPLIASILLFLYGAGRGKKGIGKLSSALAAIYNEITGWFGDILSYARLMALMLAGSVIAQVFNTLGAMPGNIIVFLVIAILGNALNFGLNLLGCYVHDLRLQCLEFFNKFYVDGGKPFRPLSLKSKYYKIVK